jgi:hypothetical protein
MMSVGRTVKDENDRRMLIKFLEGRKMPFRVEIKDGVLRTLRQNRLQRLWMTEIASQMGDRTAEEVRAYCKLHMGVAIVKAENEGFAETYDRVVKPLPYETKLKLMAEPLDLPVTRLMSTKAKHQYLNEIHHHFTVQGIVLPLPEDMKWASYERDMK